MVNSSKTKSNYLTCLHTAFSLPKWKIDSKDSQGFQNHARNIDISRRRSIGYLILFMFLGSINFTAVIPSIYPYLKSLKDDVDYIYLGMCYSAYSLGQMIASPLFGYLAVKLPVKMPLSVRDLPLADNSVKRSSRLLVCLGMLLEIIGSVIYVFALDFPTEMLRVWSVIVARFIIGFGVGAAAIYRGYVNSASTSSELTLNNTLLTVAQSLGFIVGPALQTAISLIPPQYNINTFGFHFNTYTAIGHFTVILTAVTLLMAFCLFEEVYPEDVKLAKRLASEEAKKEEAKFDPLNQLLTDPACELATEKHPQVDINLRVNFSMVALSFTLYFMVMANFISFESMMNPLCINYLGWTAKEATYNNGILMMVAAISSIVIMVGLYKLMTFFNEIFFVFIAFFLMALSCLLMIPFFPPGPPLNPIALNVALDSNKTNISWIGEDTRVVSVNGSQFLPFHETRNLVYNLTESEIKEIGGCDPRNSEFCFDKLGLSLAQILISFAIFLFGYSIGYLAVYQIFGKVIAKSNGSFWMGWLTAIGSFSRFVTPTVTTATYPYKGTLFPFALLFSLTALVMLCSVAFYFYRGRNMDFLKHDSEAGEDDLQPQSPVISIPVATPDEEAPLHSPTVAVL